MAFWLIDPRTGVPNAARGPHGKLIAAPPADASAITPDNNTVYNPPLSVTVWDAAAETITVVPYGMKGDAQVTYPTKPGMRVPVLAKKVLASGTTATVIRGQLVYVSGGEATIFGDVSLEGGGSVLTEGSTPLELESGP
jgi:hypothetical protein